MACLSLHRLPSWGDDGKRLMAEGRERSQPLLDAYLQELPGPSAVARTRS